MPLDSHPTVSSAEFPTTHWTRIIHSSGQSLENEAALEELCRTYWPPLYAFLRRQGRSPHDAEDLVQGFLARILARDDFGAVGPEKGRFRTFLLTALRNFVVKQALQEKTQKRGGGRVIFSINTEAAERLCGADLSAEKPELAFDQHWFRTVLSLALERLRNEQRARGKEAIFAELAPFLDGADPGEYEEAGRKLGLAAGTVAVTVHRLRARLQDLIRAEIIQTVANSEQADQELLHLMSIWQR